MNIDFSHSPRIYLAFFWHQWKLLSASLWTIAPYFLTSLTFLVLWWIVCIHRYKNRRCRLLTQTTLIGWRLMYGCFDEIGSAVTVTWPHSSNRSIGLLSTDYTDLVRRVEFSKAPHLLTVVRKFEARSAILVDWIRPSSKRREGILIFFFFVRQFSLRIFIMGFRSFKIIMPIRFRD